MCTRVGYFYKEISSCVMNNFVGDWIIVFPVNIFFFLFRKNLGTLHTIDIQ
jgi:hypothetical protein